MTQRNAALAAAIESVTARVQRLEDEVFPKRPPGSPGLGEWLQQLDQRLRSLKGDLADQDAKYMKQFKELVEIVAELKAVVAEPEPRRGISYLEAGE